MPGTRGTNIRKGDLAEGLGLELLRPFAFIAPVPRSEDVGVDAVATLFRADGSRLLAEDSFLVQVKATSVREIEYRGEQLDWFRELKLPFFWLSLDLANVTAELWSLTHATQHPNFRDRKCVTVYRDPRQFDIPGDEMHVSLEKPILRWTPNEAADENFQKTAYEVLKAWIAFEMKCLAIRPLGMTLRVKWETNAKPEPGNGYCIMHHPSELRSKLEQICPYIQMLNSLAWRVGVSEEDPSNHLLFGLTLLSEYMRQQGVDPDPDRMLEIFIRSRCVVPR